MKKMTFVAGMAIAAVTLASCGKAGAPKASLKSDIDSLSYSIGVGLSEEFKMYNILQQEFGVDSAYVADFIRGAKEALGAANDKKQAAYYAGLQFGKVLTDRVIPSANQQFFGEDSTKTINGQNMLAAFFTGIKGDSLLIKADQGQKIQEQFRQKQEEIREAKLQENKVAGEKWLEENKTKEGVQTTESGLQYKVLTKGTGKVPTAESKVKVEYEGRLMDGTVFDSSAQHGSEPAQFAANQVIKGWTEALTMMPVGSEWEVYIPQELAYGQRDMGTIKPYSTLIFKMKLVDIVE